MFSNNPCSNYDNGRNTHFRIAYGIPLFAEVIVFQFAVYNILIASYGDIHQKRCLLFSCF
jgi:hypothetical protein